MSKVVTGLQSNPVTAHEINNNIIEISLIDFNADAENRVTHYDSKNPSYATNETQLDSIISGMGYATGTNWEDGLLHAYKEASWYKTNQPNESVHIIFLTDGEPYNYNNYNDSGEVTGNTHGDQGTAWTNASDDARKLINDNGTSTGWNLYGIFTYGGTTGGRQLKNLINYAYTGTGNANSPITNQNWNTATITNEDKFYYASDTSGLLNYFQKIIDSVTNTVGYAGVEWEDGVTLGVTNTSVTVDGTIHESSITYKVKSGNTTLYTVKIANGVATFNISGQEEPLTDNTPETVVTKIDPDDNTTWITSTVYSVKVGDKEYKMSPATIDPETGLVDWDLAGIGILENGYTYEMTFDVWPNQWAYDLVADLNNGVKTLDQIKAELIEEHGEEDGTALYNQIVAALVDNEDGTYSIRTNWKQEVNYYTADVEKDEDGNVISTTYTSHDPYDYEYQRTIALTSSPLTMIKEWDSSLDESQYGNLLWKDYPTNSDPTKYQVKLHVWKADTAAELQNLIDQYAGDPTTASANDYLEKTLGWNADLQEYVWTSSLAIAPGTMVSVDTARDEMGLVIDPSRVVEYDYDGDGQTEEYYIIESGHYYYVTEDNIDWHFELQTQVYHPMLVNGVLCNVTFETDDDGNVKGVENIENMSEVQATNSKTAELDITKKIDDQTGKLTDDLINNETFTYKVTLTVPIDADMSHTNAYEWVARYNDDVSAANRYYVYGYQSSENPSLLGLDDDVARFDGKVYGRYTVSHDYAADDREHTLNGIFTPDAGGKTKTGEIYITLKQNEIIRLTNLPSKTEYKIEEMYNNLYQADPSRDADSNLGNSAPASNIESEGYEVTVATKNGEPTVSGRVITGTVNELNKRYYNQYKNTIKVIPNIVEFKVTKRLVGYNWSGERYYFRLEPVGNEPMPKSIKNQVYVSNDSGSDNITYSFGHIRFQKAGEYQYKITELDPATAGISQYSAVPGVTGYGTEKIITVKVENDSNGKPTVVSVTGSDTTGEKIKDGSGNDIEGTLSTNTTFTNMKGVDIKLLKIGNNDEETTLDGVQFKLYNNADCAADHQVKTDVLGNKIGGNDDGIITTANGGTADIGRLSTGTYYLQEIQTAAGYKLLPELITITVDGNGVVTYVQPSYAFSRSGEALYKIYKYTNSDGEEVITYRQSTDSDTVPDSYEFAGYRITVNNTNGEVLPNSGGIGTTIFYILGSLLVIGCGIVLVSRRRMGSDK